MNVCLIEPPKFMSLTNPVSTIAMPPLGLAYIAGSLEADGHNVSIVNAVGNAPTQFFTFGQVRCRGLEIPQIVERIPDDADLIGIGLMFTSHWPMVRSLIQSIRHRFPDRPIILGGEHGTGMPEMSLEQSPLDVVVMGEGEETAVEVVRALQNRSSLESIAGIAYRKGDAIVVNPRRNRLKGIDDIPLPAWHLFDIESYMSTNQPHGASQGRFMPMLATRGCPFQCTFCTSPQMWTQLWVPRNVKLVVDEMEMYHKRYGTVDFQFEDLTAIVRKDWIMSFCDEIVNRGLKITFQLPSGTRSEAIDTECATKLKAAGCHEFAFAPESGDPRILKAIKKQVKLDRMFQAGREAMAAGINVGCFFIIGFPEDDYMSVLRTYGATVKCAWLGFTNVNFNAYSPQPNTESFRKLQADGVITTLDDEYLMSLFTFQDFGALKKSYNRKFSNLELTLLVMIGYLCFYTFYFLRRPQRIFQLFVDLFKGSGRNKTSKMAGSLLKDAYRILRRQVSAPSAR